MSSIRCRTASGGRHPNEPVAEKILVASMPHPLGYPFILVSPVPQATGTVLGCKKCVNVCPAIDLLTAIEHLGMVLGRESLVGFRGGYGAENMTRFAADCPVFALCAILGEFVASDKKK